MPAHELHRNLDVLYIGEEFPEVHATLDMFAGLMQSNHRAMLHDFGAVMYFWERERDVRKTWSAFAHIILDKISMEVGKNRCLATFIERLYTGSIPAFDVDHLPPKHPHYFGDDERNYWNDDDAQYVVI